MVSAVLVDSQASDGKSEVNDYRYYDLHQPSVASMTSPHVLQTVRETLARWLSNRHAGETFSARESILIRDGFYCGRRFEFADYQAVWFVEEGIVKVFSNSGDLLSRLVIQEHHQVQEHRRAA